MKSKEQVEELKEWVRNEYFENLKRGRGDLNSYYERVWDVCDWVLDDNREKLSEKKITEAQTLNDSHSTSAKQRETNSD